MMEIHVEFFLVKFIEQRVESLSFLLAVFAYYHRNRFLEDIFNAFFSVVLKLFLNCITWVI